MAVSRVSVRLKFFDYLFGDQIGFLCIATASPTAMTTTFDHHYFEWPLESAEVARFVEQQSINNHVWFCVSLLRGQSATKESCLPGSFLWADLDEVTPDDLKAKSVPATAALETSPGRYQGFWRLEQSVPPDVREDLSKKITYYVGADKGGWACNKLMRVPYTINHKYKGKPVVELLNAYETLIPVDVFEGLPEPTQDPGAIPTPDMPDLLKLPAPENIIYKYSYALLDTPFKSLYIEEPRTDQDWSNRMWLLINTLLECKLEKEEVFALCIEAKCNKYKRDNRPIGYLWKEIVKAEAIQQKGLTLLGEYKPLRMPELVDPNLEMDNFVTQYKDWASKATDAVEEYHELCAFMLLSSVLAANLKLSASFGKLVPNLWGLVLGDSTLTRKTTAMEMAMSFLKEVDKDAVVATDGSPEGLITVLSQRPEQVSVYFKDEVSGLFAAINSKSYLHDMPEVLTKMYDVPDHYPRVLRSGTIVVTSPFFIFFGGGIKEKVYEEVKEDYVLSGFLPRFLIVSGYTDLSKIRPVGPPTPETSTGRANIASKIAQIHDTYCMTVHTRLGTQLIPAPQNTNVVMGTDAWEFFAEMDRTLTKTASESPNSLLAQPTFTRLAFSSLKMAMLLAAARGSIKDKNVVVTVQDLKEAAWFVQSWGRHTIDLITNAGITKNERIIDRILTTVRNHPGCTKTYLMRTHSKLSSKEMTDLMQTIFDRGLVEAKREGRTMRFWAVGQ